MSIEDKKAELAQLRERIRELEDEVLHDEAGEQWQATGFYGSYYATTGFMLGIFGAVASLIANVIAAPIAGKHPLELIRVYLTFPLGAKALQLTSGAEDVYVIGDGVVIAIGCCLYIATGMVLGVVFQLVLTRLVPNAGLVARLVVATILAVIVWLVNFYGVLVWLQPMLFDGDWITDTTILPWWVALATHLVFGWTMATVYPWGKYHPYVRPTRRFRSTFRSFVKNLFRHNLLY